MGEGYNRAVTGAGTGITYTGGAPEWVKVDAKSRPRVDVEVKVVVGEGGCGRGWLWERVVVGEGGKEHQRNARNIKAHAGKDVHTEPKHLSSDKDR